MKNHNILCFFFENFCIVFFIKYLQKSEERKAFFLLLETKMTCYYKLKICFLN